jgi:hypothetical protein
LIPNSEWYNFVGLKNYLKIEKTRDMLWLGITLGRNQAAKTITAGAPKV